MTGDNIPGNLSGRISVLEAIIPRVERIAEETNKLIFTKLDFIRDNMVTQKQLAEELHGIQKYQTSNDDMALDNKKKIQNLQLQVYGLGIVFVISLFVGAAKTLSVISVIGPKIISP